MRATLYGKRSSPCRALRPLRGPEVVKRAPRTEVTDALLKAAGFSVLLTELQFCEIGQFSTTTAARWREQGKGPPWVRLEKLVRYPLEPTVAWLKAGGDRAEQTEQAA